MAVSTSFKQPCPSCEALVPIRDISMVGKKIDCPKCKYKFQIEKPKPAKDEKAQKKKFRDEEPEEDEEEADELEEIEEDEDEEDEPPAKKKPQVKAPVKDKPQAKKGKPADEDDEILEEEEDDEPPKKSAKKARDDEDDEDKDADDDEDDGKKKKKKGGSKLVLGLALAGVGVVVLGLAAFMMMGGSGPNKPTAPTIGPRASSPTPPPTTPPETKIEETKKDDPKKDDPKKDDPKKDETPAVVAPSNEVELAQLTNFLPNDTDHVIHVFFKDILEANSPLRDASFNGPGVLDDADLRKKLGFSLLAVDDLIRAENYKGLGWTFTILHLREPVSEVNLKATLGLKPLPAIKNQPYFMMADYNPWFDHLARLTFGVPVSMRQLDSRTPNRPSYVRLHGPQTLIIADQVPMEAFLQAEGAFAILSNRPGTNPDPNAPPPPPPSPLEGTVWEGKDEREGAAIRLDFTGTDQVKLVEPKETTMGTYQLNDPAVTMTFPGRVYTSVHDGKTITGEARDDAGKMWKFSVAKKLGARPGLASGGDLRAEMYLTIRPELKVLLDKMETKTTGAKVLYSAATNMEAARVASLLPDFKDRVSRRPRQVWDVALLLNEAKPRMRFLGAGLNYKDGKMLEYRNEVACGQEIDVKELQKDLVDRVAPQIARFLDKLLGQRVELPKMDAATATTPPGPGTTVAVTPMPGVTPTPPAAPDHSLMKAVANGSALEFTIHLVLDTSGLARVYGVTAMAAGALRAEMDLSAIVPARHALARAGQKLGENGLSDRDVPTGRWPPAAFPRPSAARLEREPLQRISWMAGLLPYLGHDTLYGRIEFKDSWRDPANWLAARTLVPQFLDPTYPDVARRTLAPGIPVEVGATHFVGIAGVGLDAASYRPGDPATNHLRGVLNYERSLGVDEVQKGRGLSNTILMIQVPHDGVAGVTPWIAGGGSTLRGVPEKNSIAPFVLSTDRSGKTIQHQGKRGTFALMTDGSVRFIDQLVSDEVFKALCTAAGPAPEKFDPDKDENTPLVPDPNRKVAPKTSIKPKPAVKPPAAPEAPRPETKPAAEEKKAEPTKVSEPAKKAEPEKKAPPVPEAKKAATPEVKKAPAADGVGPAERKPVPRPAPAEEKKLSWHRGPADRECQVCLVRPRVDRAITDEPAEGYQRCVVCLRYCCLV